MSDETRNKLISALRQFRHSNDNTGSITRPEQGFVFAYDRDETEGLVASLEKKLEQAEARCAELEQDAKNAASSIIRTVNSRRKTILIKQAEAIEDWLRGDAEMGGLDEYANRLRQQAHEIESGDNNE